MCGIFAIFSSSLSEVDLRRELISCSSRLRHRGPDWSGYKVIEANETEYDITLPHGIAHERLAIMDPESGSQPLVSDDGNIIVAANGEVYNYKELYAGLKEPYVAKTGSDCEVLLPLYKEHGPSVEIPRLLRGMFSFILYDRSRDLFYIVRDHMGITPLYIGWGTKDGSIFVSSEMKALQADCTKFQQFPPGHIFCNKGEKANEFQRWYTPNWAPEMKPIAGINLPTNSFQAVCIFYLIEFSIAFPLTLFVPRPVEIGFTTSCFRAKCHPKNDVRCAVGSPTLWWIGLVAGGSNLRASYWSPINVVS
jgi:asparagine synthase (glutamine-hydrolysing)